MKYQKQSLSRYIAFDVIDRGFLYNKVDFLRQCPLFCVNEKTGFLKETNKKFASSKSTKKTNKPKKFTQELIQLIPDNHPSPYHQWRCGVDNELLIQFVLAFITISS